MDFLSKFFGGPKNKQEPSAEEYERMKELYARANSFLRSTCNEESFNSNSWKELDEKTCVRDLKKLHEQHYAKYKSWIFFEVSSKDDFMYRALALGKAGNKEYAKAIEYCSKGLSINPTSIYLLYLRGRTYGDLGDFNKGIADLSKAIKLQPKMADSYIERGFIYQKMKNITKARSDYEKAREIEPNIVLPQGWQSVLMGSPLK